jgi:glycosyltransferase involved in cell wall biosynthesis
LEIGLLAPPWIPLPPSAYGGTEQVVALLAEGLAAAGHEVTVVAAPGSRLRGPRVVSPLEHLPQQIGLALKEWRHALAGASVLEAADVVIDHSGPAGALAVADGRAPALHVAHGPLAGDCAELYRLLCARAPALRLVAISNAQRALAPDLPFLGTCRNGIDLAPIPYRARPDGYLAFLGRMAAEKGAAEAIEIARAARLPLMIAAKCREAAERDYFAREVEPHLGRDVVWLGELGAEAKYELLAGARALLFPISWPEPFGMVMIEAMACGTPVLATRHGAVAEVVSDGRTGFVRRTPRELAQLVGRIGEIDRRRCRRHVARSFSAQAMTRAYERVIARALRLAPVRRAPRVRPLPGQPGRPARGGGFAVVRRPAIAGAARPAAESESVETG